ncbi:hypothetical protein [Acidisphaera sp. L21]|jgi:hypothetical protein|uniref:hypothetical protein n=1 Tax=Acidisphaera sp. L21 TaxID=1641851 RepID=UPI00131B246C|nr:hypothetical protein [Acidisphaera sp. L21]
MKTITRRIVGGFVLAASVAAAAPAFAQRDPAAPGPVVGRVTITAKAAAVGVGYTWGNGVLTYAGHRYRFTVKGVTVADVGFSTIVGHGRVYNLHRLSDFSGTYAAATGEATLGNGLGGQFLKNGQGVELRIDDVTKGARLSGSADGIQLEIVR